MKTSQAKVDGFSYWNVKASSNNNELLNFDEDERSIALSVKLLSKNRNILQQKTVQLPSHLVESPPCGCHRSFHIFCTDLLQEKDDNIEMINIHPAPRIHDRDSSRRLPTPYQKNRLRISEDSDHDTIISSRSEPCHAIRQEIPLSIEKKLNHPPKYPPTRTTSLNIPPTSANQRALQAQLKYSPSFRITKRSITPVEQLEVRALSVFDQSPSTSQYFIPRGPPPSPKTPTLESSTLLMHSINPNPNPAPLRAISITPCPRTSIDLTRKSFSDTTPVIVPNHEDNARQYLSASDCSDDEKDDDNEDDDNDTHEPDKYSAKILSKRKTKLSNRSQSLAKPAARLRDRLLTHTANHYLSLAEVYYSSLDAYKNLADKSRRRFRSQTRLMTSTNDNDDACTTMTTTKTIATTTATTATTAKISPMPQSKSSFGFAKTASSMHFGYAAGRLGLRGSFEKWPQPLSHRTPIERKQEVTTLRLVTLPLVTS